MNFQQRIQEYEKSYDLKIINRLPIIVSCDIRSAHRVTKKLLRPYCDDFLDIMGKSMLNSIMEIDGAVFGYHFSDEISFIINSNSDDPWYQNRIQKLTSIVSSILSINFFKNLQKGQIDLDGDAIFAINVFPVPTLSEAVNYLILKQQECFQYALTHASLYEFNKLYGKDAANKLLLNKNNNEKLDLLFNECNIDFDKDYSLHFRRGIASYKIPRLNEIEDIIKYKWILDYNIPTFITDKNFISNILYSGYDVVRVSRDLNT